ncbi:conserved hypothetical protein [Paecilomyces variotii No. 5]|uniref:Urease accessory protein UreD n=1 Tax=Byssochlamys spectabilis (strain No. 5 / NBRC 109023) TaxID=1356009 RepID=V5FIZ7_BYSSN|nr:conserved hypothetical protein [Paecilomyces variotii No. 5]
MPHKHKRRKNDEAAYDLPPSAIAKPLPVRDAEAKNKNKNNDKNKKNAGGDNGAAANKKKKSRAGGGLVDDTPKAFARLLQLQKTGRMPSGLDDGSKSKKRKRDGAGDDAEKTTKKTEAPSSKGDPAIPKILPGEKLSDYSARVNMALPLSGISKSKNPASGDLPKLRETRQTKHEKHLRRLQQGWREDEAKIREREQEEREEREAEMEEQLDLWKEWEAEAGKNKAKKKGNKSKKKKKGKNGLDSDIEDDDDDDDPWEKLKERDRASRPANPLEVVQAPPQLTKPREVFKVRGGARVDVANVPNAAGSLRRREELAGERKSIVEEYRRLMAEKRQQGS